ncbi:hypothetical protein K502DRAFT_247136 [Neoconidiobolus thromboides FSU 785]|nr:hypothetical protein K502DRAFT_247136 [Neoconidiobolus thromboides FSU 785]
MVLSLLKKEFNEIDNVELNSQLKLKQSEVTLTIEPTPDFIEFSEGTLYINESFFGFYSTVSETGFKLDYRSLVLHALTMDPESHKPILYCQINKLFQSLLPNGHDTGDLDEFSELKFTFHSVGDAEPIYMAISQCQELYPDQDSENEQETDINEMEFNGRYSDADADAEEDNME